MVCGVHGVVCLCVLSGIAYQDVSLYHMCITCSDRRCSYDMIVKYLNTFPSNRAVCKKDSILSIKCLNNVKLGKNG